MLHYLILNLHSHILNLHLSLDLYGTMPSSLSLQVFCAACRPILPSPVYLAVPHMPGLRAVWCTCSPLAMYPRVSVPRVPRVPVARGGVQVCLRCAVVWPTNASPGSVPAGPPVLAVAAAAAPGTGPAAPPGPSAAGPRRGRPPAPPTTGLAATF